jgi:translation initiation factor eIF-2B subunit alpha
VIVTACAPLNSGAIVKKQLEDFQIPTQLISDAAVGLALQSVDCIFVGCEGVVENGGIVNKVGTYTIALCAKMF